MRVLFVFKKTQAHKRTHTRVASPPGRLGALGLVARNRHHAGATGRLLDGCLWLVLPQELCQKMSRS